MYHAGAGKSVPTESDTIAILDIAPLILERLVIHCECCSNRAGDIVEAQGNGRVAVIAVVDDS